MPGQAFRCEVCDGVPQWRILRRGDVVVSWACPSHLSEVCVRLQRHHELTELVITDSPKAREWADVAQRLAGVHAETVS
jgi:hypothetical protein